MSLAAEQRLMARFLTEPEVEREVRENPGRAALRYEVNEVFAERLAVLDPARVSAFRASRDHKNALRAGAKPSRIA